MTEATFTQQDFDAARAEALAAERARIASILGRIDEGTFELARACIDTGLTGEQSSAMLTAARAPAVQAGNDAMAALAKIMNGSKS